jgi:dynein heavy chain
MQYIEALPQIANPSVFGMHENAKIASANAETFSMFDILLSLQASGGGGGSSGSTREKLIESTAMEIHAKEFKLFDIENVSLLYPVVYEESMNTVLLQECIRYNKLIAVLLKTIPDLLKALKGLVAMSTELDAIATSLALNQVPKSWANNAYPSMKPCSSWMDDLVERIQFINSWIDKGQPSVFWISGFYFPQAFLTGSMQNYARKFKFPIDTIGFNFNLKKDAWSEIRSQPEHGIYIRGLFLEGARWDHNIQSLNDSLPKQLYTELPVIHLLPEQYRADPTQGVYRCPVYKILSRRGVLSTTGHSTNFIMWIEIPSNRESTPNNEGKSDQNEWIRAGVAAFSSLMY